MGCAVNTADHQVVGQCGIAWQALDSALAVTGRVVPVAGRIDSQATVATGDGLGYKSGFTRITVCDG